jgi:flagellar basal body-associated protein FliL
MGAVSQTMPEHLRFEMNWRFLRRCLLLSTLPSILAALPAHAVDRERGASELIPGIAVFVNIRPITLPVIEGNRVTRQVGVLLTVELTQGHLKQEATEKEHELTDAFITDLYRMYGASAGASRVVDEKLLKTRLQATAERVLGPGVVQAVLIRQLVEQNR